MAIPFPQIDPVAVAIGPVQIHWYALAYLAGFLLGWRYALYIAGKDPEAPRAVTKPILDDFFPWAILGVILGGRIGYVLFYQSAMYLSDPLEALKIWHGGMSFHGGAAGMIIAMIIYARVKKISTLRLTDMICCAVPIGLFFGRLANFVNGELFGRTTNVAWGVVFPQGGPDPRHASQLYEALFEGLILFLVMLWMVHRDGIRNRPGLLSAVFLGGYAVARFSIEFFREPDPQLGFLFAGATMGQLLCIPMLLGALYTAYYAMKKGYKPA